MGELFRTVYDARAQLTRRLLLGFALVVPFVARRARAADRVTFGNLWQEGKEFSERAKALAGQAVEMRGYMAPPLKPEVDFFVLASQPLATCPFCDDAAAWPEDIVMVLLRGPRSAQAYNRAILVSGTLDIGTETEDKTGFVSRIRLKDAQFKYA